MTFIVRNPRTKMFLAKQKANPRYRSNASAWRWVRSLDDAERFACYSDAELPAIFINLDDPEICPVLSCGLLGDPMHRDDAIATGRFHSARATISGGTR